METISFAGDGLAAGLLPVEELADCAATALAADGKRILSYGTGAGYTPLRELIGERFGVHPQRVWLTNGWLQGFALLARDRVGGSNVLVEYPTYDRALRLLFAAGASMLYVDWHDQGLAVDALASQVRMNTRPALALLSPSFHNPTGQSLSLAERQEVCRILYGAGLFLVEDDTYGPLRFEGEAVPTLFEVMGQRSVYSTSLSLTIAPGLRIGVFILPAELSVELATKANDTYISPALLGQATAFEFFARGSYDTHVQLVAARLHERRNVMLAALERHLPRASWSRPEGGIFVLLRLPPGTDAAAALAGAEGVTALPGSGFGGLPNTIRLNYAEPELDAIEAGIERLAAAVNGSL